MRGFQILVGAVLGAFGWASLTLDQVQRPLYGLVGGLVPAGTREGLVDTVNAGLSYGVGFGSLFAGALLVVFGALGALFAMGSRQGAAAPQSEGVQRKRLETFHEMLGGAAARMVGADGQIKDSEIAMVQGVVERFDGPPIDAATVRKLAEGGMKRAEVFLGRMKDEAATLSADQKEHIVRACLLVAISDLQVSDEERDFVTQVATALGVDRAKLNEINGAVTKTAQKLLGVAAETA